MLASPTPEYRSPKHHREVCEQARKWSTVPWIIDGVLVYVDDLDRHFKRATAAGAMILSEIADPGFEELWENSGYAGFRNGDAQFILQKYRCQKRSPSTRVPHQPTERISLGQGSQLHRSGWSVRHVGAA